MNDIDDVLRRTYAPPPVASGVRPSPERLAAALRAGHRRRARRQAAAGVGAAALTVGLLLGVVALRHDAGDEGIPADTTSVATAATTVPGATPPASTATGTTVAGPVAAGPGLPQFLALSTSGRIEVWARTGLVRTLDGCAGVTSGDCEVTSAAVGGGRVWFSRRVGASGAGTRLFAAPLTGSADATEVSALGEPDGTVVGVSADGADVLLLANGALVRTHDGTTERIATDVIGGALSGDGRLAYTTGGSLVIRTLADGTERRIDVAAAAARSGVTLVADGSPAGPLQWSPDRSRLLVGWAAARSGSVVTVDVADRAALTVVSPAAFVPACWTGNDTVVVGDWAPTFEGGWKGPFALVSATNGQRVGAVVGSFVNAGDVVCRGDGAVATVLHRTTDWTGGGDLTVINAKGDATRLGVEYATVLPLGSGPLALLDPATLPTPTTSVAPRLTAKASDAFAALTGDGKLDVWTPTGKVLTIDVGTNTCEPAAYAKCGSPDKVGTVTLTERSVWYGGADGVLWRAALDGSTAPTKVSTDAGAIEDIAVSADDAVVWFVRHTGILEGTSATTLIRRERGVEAEVATGVVSVALSPDGTRLAYTRSVTPADSEPFDGVGELVVTDLTSGTTVRRPIRNGNDGGVPFRVVDLQWSPDGTRLSADDSWEGVTKIVLDPAATTPIVELDRPLGGRPLGCWTTGTTLALANPRIPYADEAAQPGDVESLDLAGGQPRSYGASVYSTSIACRSDGSVALVDGVGQTGELVVVRPGGVRTVLGRAYRRVLE